MCETVSQISYLSGTFLIERNRNRACSYPLSPTVPEHIREVLTTRYEYVVAEKEIIPDLTDLIRLCDNCENWCPRFVYRRPYLCCIA